MIQRRPHTVFALVWAGLMGAALAVGIIGLHVSAWWSLAVGLAILTAEIVAVAYPGDLRTTLSEVTTYVNRQLSKRPDPGRGWNTLVAIQAAIMGRMVYVIIVAAGGPETAWFAVIVSVLFAIGQHDHWLDPPKWG